MAKAASQLTLTDALIRTASLPPGKAQHYLHDDKLPGLALRMRATGARTWVYLFTKPGVSLRTIMSRCGYDNEIQRLCVGQKPGGIDQVYNHDEQWIIRKMAFEAAHDYIAELVGAERTGKVVRLQRTNPLDLIKAELLGRLREHFAAGGA